MYDCIIIGGGPAGLMAATYLGRFRRHVILFDNQLSRAALIPKSHNYPGTFEGISGKAILKQLRKQAEKYGVTIVHATIEHLELNADGIFTVSSSQQTYQAYKVLLATGVVNIEPKLPYLNNAIQKGYIRHCMICDGYEQAHHRAAIIGYTKHALKEALFLRTYTEHVTLLTLGNPCLFDENDYTFLQKAHIKLVHASVSEVILEGHNLTGFRTLDGELLTFDTVYSALGTSARSELASQVGAQLGADGCVVTDPHQRTSVVGLYAAGDVIVGLDQMSTAFGNAALTAVDIHNTLEPNFLKPLQAPITHADIIQQFPTPLASTQDTLNKANLLAIQPDTQIAPYDAFKLQTAQRHFFAPITSPVAHKNTNSKTLLPQAEESSSSEEKAESLQLNS